MSPQSLFWRQYVFTWVIISFGCFMALTGVAMLYYPGGTMTNPNSVGYSFFKNFFSELGLTVTHAGQSNTVSAVLFLVALTLAGAGLIFFFLAFRQFFTQSAAEKWLSGIGTTFGVIAGICFVGIAFTPANLSMHVHLQFVVWAFRTFPLAVVCYATAIFCSRQYPRRYGFVFVAFAVLLVLYLGLLETGPDFRTPEGMMIQATGQKIIAYATIVTLLIQANGAKHWVKSQALTTTGD